MRVAVGRVVRRGPAQVHGSFDASMKPLADLEPEPGTRTAVLKKLTTAERSCRTACGQNTSDEL
jgi:hypothetical protein